MLNRYRIAVVSDFDEYRTNALRQVPDLASLEPADRSPFGGELAVFPFGDDPDSVVLSSAYARTPLLSLHEPTEAVRMIVPTTAAFRLGAGQHAREIAATGMPAFAPARGMSRLRTAGHFFEIRIDRDRLADGMRAFDSEADIGLTLDRVHFDQRLPGLPQIADHVRHVAAAIDSEPANIIDFPAFRKAHGQLLLIRIAHVLAEATAPEWRRSVGRNRPALARAVEFIASHADGPIEYPLIAEHAGLSLRSLQLLFRRELDCTIVQFVQRRRLAKARDRLEREGRHQTVAAIARASGFNHLSEFARCYKALYGETPRETQQRARRSPVRTAP